MNCSRRTTFLLLSTTISMAIGPVMAADIVSTQSSSTQKTTEMGEPTIIQHIDSKMEPIAVQSSNKTDPTTGETKTVVQPIIMERHDKVLDTTIIQPQVTETKTVKENVVRTQQSPHAFHKVVVKPHAVVHKPPKHHIVARHMSDASSYKPKESSRVSSVETVTQQAAIKETTIIAPPAPAPAPQIIEKTE
jgi:hypothetical protein